MRTGPPARTGVRAAIARRPARPRAGAELALLAMLYVGYSLARLLADDNPVRAIGNAHHLLGLEAALHLDVESWANHLFLDLPGLPLAASYWYSALHYIVTPAVLVWVYRRHPLGYRRVRNALVARHSDRPDRLRAAAGRPAAHAAGLCRRPRHHLGERLVGERRERAQGSRRPDQ